MSSEYGGAGRTRTERTEKWLKPIAKGKPAILPSGEIVYTYKAKDLIFRTEGSPIRKKHKETGEYYYQDGQGTWRFFNSGKPLTNQEIRIKPGDPRYKSSKGRKHPSDPNETSRYIPHEGTQNQFVFDYRNAMKEQIFNQQDPLTQQELNKGQFNVNKTLAKSRKKQTQQDLEKAYKESIRQQRIDLIKQQHLKREAKKLHEQRLEREATQGKPSAKRQYDRAVKQELDKGGSRAQPHETSADVTRRLKRDLRRAEQETARQAKQARIQELEKQLKEKRQNEAQLFDKAARKQSQRDFQKMKSDLEQTGTSTYRSPDGKTIYTHTAKVQPKKHYFVRSKDGKTTWKVDIATGKRTKV